MDLYDCNSKQPYYRHSGPCLELPTPWRNEPVLDKLLIGDEFYGLLKRQRQSREKKDEEEERTKIHETDTMAHIFTLQSWSSLGLGCVGECNA